MPRSLGARLPESLLHELGGEALESCVGNTYLLLTSAPDGFPHVAMLSAGEVLAIAADELRLALWPGSRTTANLATGGLATLMAVVPPATLYLHLRATRMADITVQGRPRALFSARVEEALEDVVQYATVTSGIDFALADPPATLATWAETVRAMRAVGQS